MALATAGPTTGLAWRISGALGQRFARAAAHRCCRCSRALLLGLIGPLTHWGLRADNEAARALRPEAGEPQGCARAAHN